MGYLHACYLLVVSLSDFIGRYCKHFPRKIVAANSVAPPHDIFSEVKEESELQLWPYCLSIQYANAFPGLTFLTGGGPYQQRTES